MATHTSDSWDRASESSAGLQLSNIHCWKLHAGAVGSKRAGMHLKQHVHVCALMEAHVCKSCETSRTHWRTTLKQALLLERGHHTHTKHAKAM